MKTESNLDSFDWNLEDFEEIEALEIEDFPEIYRDIQQENGENYVTF